MTPRKSFLLYLVAGALALSVVAGFGQAAPAAWPAADGTYTIDHFQFKDGETIDHLRLHYLTLGQPHRDTAGHVDNAVLLLHGTGGDAHSLLNPIFSNVLFVPGGVLDITNISRLPDDIGHGRRASHRMDCICGSRNLTMTTWCARST